jgi:hypothetical protein
MRTSTKEMLWFPLIVIFLAFQLVVFVGLWWWQFHLLSIREILLYAALLIVGLLGVLVKDRKSRS